MELSVNDLRDVTSGNGHESYGFVVGKAYFVQTVTLYFTGRVVSVTDSVVCLEEAAWIADTGRLSDSLITGEFSEVEPYPGHIFVSLGSIAVLSEWQHELPRIKK